MTNNALNSEQAGLRRLQMWNPLDHLRLLWWVLFAPGQLAAYWSAYGENAETKLWVWWANTFRWIPIFLHRGFKEYFFTEVMVWFINGLSIIDLPHSVGRVARSCWLSVFSCWVLLACMKLDVSWVVFVPFFILISGLDIIITDRDIISKKVYRCYKNNRISWIVQLGFLMLIATCCVIICAT